MILSPILISFGQAEKPDEARVASEVASSKADDAVKRRDLDPECRSLSIRMGLSR